MQVRYIYKSMSRLSKSRMYRKTTVGDKLRSIIGLLAEEIKSDYGTSRKKKKKKKKERKECSGLRAGWERTKRNQAKFA